MNKQLARACALAFAAGAFGTAAAADRDRDGIEDRLDNCVQHYNPGQSDTDADGIGNRCDADFNNNGVVDPQDFSMLKSVFGSKRSPEQDLNDNGVVDPLDFSIVKAFFGRSPGPAGQEAFPLTSRPDMAIEADYLVRTSCNRPWRHTLSGHVDIANAGGPATYTATLIDGTGQQTSAGGTAGRPFELSVEATNEAIIGVFIILASSSAGTEAKYTETLVLPPCGPPPHEGPDGFTTPDQDLPPVITTPDGLPDETDVIHLGGSPFGPTAPRIVAAAGTGAGVRLYSYTMDFGTQQPIPLQVSDTFAGLDVKLHTLDGPISPNLTVNPFIAGVRVGGNLWLTSWQLFGDGSFLDVSHRGYGENAHLHVEAYAIAHRRLNDGDYQVVTPVRTNNDRLRLVTWEVDSATGTVVGRDDSGDFGNPADNAELGVAHLSNGLYVVSYENVEGDLRHHYWQVNSNGTPQSSGSATSGLNLDGSGNFVEPVAAVFDLPLLTDDFVTPTLNRNGELEMHVWETRWTSFADPGLIYTPYHISEAANDQLPDAPGVLILPEPTPTDSTQNVRAMLVDGKVEDIHGNGSGELFEEFPLLELLSVHTASVTKNMTLLIAVEAINDGEVGLNDDVTVSADAAGLGGSSMGLQTDETQTLQTLLHGMMLVSGNDAAAAIAEYISGSFETFIARMNLRAGQLGMVNTVYNVPGTPGQGPGNGATTTPRDQIDLWLAARELPLFAQVASARQYSGCGETAGGVEQCYFLNKFADSGYPGLEGWKGGNGGAFISGYSDNGGPYCVGSGCLVAEAYRLDRPMVVGLQQTNNRWGDADEMFDYGFLTQFTPDHRGEEASGGLIYDFGLDAVGDTAAVTADIDGFDRDLKVCTWAVNIDSGLLDQNGCHRRTVTGLAASTDGAPPTQVDGARLSETFADGDYITGHFLNNTLLRLNLFRVGNQEP